MIGHTITGVLERRLRSPECRAGRTDCIDPLCLCTCHEQTYDDRHARRVIDALDHALWHTTAGAA